MASAATAVIPTIDPVEEAGWIRGVARGDPLSFRRLYDRFRGVIFSTVFKVLGDREETEDTTQEVFAQIWQKAHLFKADRGRALTWISTMARNRAIDRLRKKQRRLRLSETFFEREEAEEELNTRDASDDVEISERARLARNALTLLNADQRQAIELVYMKGYTHAEVATRLGLPLGTIKARVRRGLSKMREGLSTVDLAG